MTSEPQTGEPWTILGRLVRPQGRHGEILADILTDFPERFRDRRRLYLVSSETGTAFVREVTLENHWLHKGRDSRRVVLKFAGIDSINHADTLRGLLVAVPANERTPLSDGSVYIGDLIGCRIIDLNSDAATIGVVTDLDREAGLLAVKSPAGGEILVPFANAYLASMDLVAKRIEMRLPEGLLEINAPITKEERRALDGSVEMDPAKIDEDGE
jgi:16S rRNA processing protein RimM